jgi:enterochelin esterase-like enzyme/sugar lactone lactonase YvrE
MKPALSPFLVFLAASALTSHALAEDWGAYSIVSSGPKAMVLEAVGAGATDGTLVSIGKPAKTPNQKWLIVPKGDDLYAIKPSYNSSLTMAVAKGGTNNGAQIVLETDEGKPWQLWSIKKNDNGTYSLIPKHEPTKGLDDNGGNQTEGARQDLWEYHPNDGHLQWFIKPLANAAPAGPYVESEPSTYVAPDIKPEDIPKGTTKEFTFDKSEIFPGTTRKVTVFIPAQYDGSKPACVYVKTDGYNPKEQQLLERMIATKEIPVTVGVFVRPGDVVAPMKGTGGRRNRDLEYDGMGDKNVRFFAEEILPYVAKEFNLNLSTSGNDHCISGGSSGGITAFNAAWERPDLFSRVYCASGSFVAFRGGHEFPTLVRKFEAKPIRSFLTTGTHDMENCAGDWFLLDQEMDKALKFSGYDYQFRIMNGGHVAGYMDNFQEAMAYLWKDWPKPVEAGPSAPRAQDVLLPGESWQPVAEGFRDARGPAGNATGEVFFVDASANKIHRIDADGKVSEFLSDAGHANSLTVGADGKLIAISNQTGKIVSYDAAGKGSEVADGLRGDYILAMPNGGFYVTSNDGKSGSVWFVKDGKKTQVDTGLKRATGLAYRPDQWLLSVADGNSKWAYSYQINPDGTLSDKEKFFSFHLPDMEDTADAESVCYSLEGRMLTGTNFGIQVSADDGPTQVIIPVPDRGRVIGVSLGGHDLDTMYAFSSSGKIWKRKVKLHALGAFSPWTRVLPNRL